MKRLLKILYDYIKEKNCIEEGLCIDCINLYYGKHLITPKEYDKLRDYIDKNRPKRGKHYNKEMTDSSYYWPRNELAPRLAWLETHIKNPRYES